ncbi:PhoH family protein [Candidatus Woesearchaeota archaeon]|nr:PhoH family protein [Candidatus Woesearchaeota archaeon]
MSAETHQTGEKLTGYHEVFIPFPDVYEAGGPEAFSRLERPIDSGRNLIVLPFQFVEDLALSVDKSNSYGARETLSFVKKATLRDNLVCADEDLSCATYKLTGGLDICVLDTPKFSTSAGLEIGKLVNALQEKIGAGSDVPVKLITSLDKHHIRYRNLGMIVENPGFLQVDEDIVNEGILLGSEKLQAALYSNGGSLPLESAVDILGRELFINQFVRFRAEEQDTFAVVQASMVYNNRQRTRILNASDPLLTMLDPSEYSRGLTIGKSPVSSLVGILPQDMEQYLALQYGCISNDVPLFFLCGKRGSGKTLLSYAFAIDSVLHYDAETRDKRGLDPRKKGGRFEQAVILKPTEVLGGKRREVGALPGTLFQKLRPHLRPYESAHKTTNVSIPFEQMFMHPDFETDDFKQRHPDLKQRKINGGYLPPRNVLELVFSGFMGGDSIRNTLFMIDEAQDFEPYELKTILERMGTGCAAIITGDPFQTRNPNCNRKVNGLTSAIKHYLPKPYSGLIYLTRNYRHQISEDTEQWHVYPR